MNKQQFGLSSLSCTCSLLEAALHLAAIVMLNNAISTQLNNTVFKLNSILANKSKNILAHVDSCHNMQLTNQIAPF